MKDLAFKAKMASKELLKLDKNTRNEIFNNLIINLKNKEKEIIEMKLKLENSLFNKLEK